MFGHTTEFATELIAINKGVVVKIFLPILETVKELEEYFASQISL